MTWNYRIIRDEEGGLAFHEVYYDKQGNVEGWTKNMVSPHAGSLRELQEFIDSAMMKPILIEENGKLVEEQHEH
jgi:hypothetical protein